MEHVQVPKINMLPLERYDDLQCRAFIIDYFLCIQLTPEDVQTTCNTVFMAVAMMIMKGYTADVLNSSKGISVKVILELYYRKERPYNI